MEREFINGVQDCLSFISDWYYQDCGIQLPMQPHGLWWFDEGEDFMGQLYKDWGFEDINSSEIEVGDLVMMTVRSTVVNHLAIYIGDGMIAHHRHRQKPTIEKIDEWKHRIERIARHVERNTILRKGS